MIRKPKAKKAAEHPYEGLEWLLTEKLKGLKLDKEPGKDINQICFLIFT
jgi:hypothetical protein